MSAGGSGSSSRFDLTDPTVQLPPVQEMRSRGSIVGQYTYRGKRRSQTLKPGAKAIGIKIACIALAIGLIAWFLITPNLFPSGDVELTPPDSPPLLTVPEDPAPAPGELGEMDPPGDTPKPKGSSHRPNEDATGSPLPGGDSGQPLPSCQDQEPSDGSSELEPSSPAMHDPDGESGNTSKNNSSNENDTGPQK